MKYGWKRDAFDPRDHKYTLTAPVVLPAKVDLRDKCPGILNQGQLGACTAHALANAHLFSQLAQPGGIDSLPSRLWIYLQERLIEGTQFEDSGAQIRDGIKALAAVGAPPESEWPYDTSKFAEDVTSKFSDDALKHKITSYTSVPQSLVSIKTALFQEQHPIAFGFMVFESFEGQNVAQTGVVPMPQEHETELGGHAVLMVGYDDARCAFIVMNSWGSEWGDHGFFYLPYAYATDPKLAQDFWIIKTVLE